MSFLWPFNCRATVFPLLDFLDGPMKKGRIFVFSASLGETIKLSARFRNGNGESARSGVSLWCQKRSDGEKNCINELCKEIHHPTRKPRQ